MHPAANEKPSNKMLTWPPDVSPSVGCAAPTGSICGGHTVRGSAADALVPDITTQLQSSGVQAWMSRLYQLERKKLNMRRHNVMANQCIIWDPDLGTAKKLKERQLDLQSFLKTLCYSISFLSSERQN